MDRNEPQIHTLAQILVGEPVSTFAGICAGRLNFHGLGG